MVSERGSIFSDMKCVRRIRSSFLGTYDELPQEGVSYQLTRNVTHAEINIILLYYFRVTVKTHVSDKLVPRVSPLYDVTVVFGISVPKSQVFGYEEPFVPKIPIASDNTQSLVLK